MSLILPARTLDSGYEISNSLRFNDGDSPSLQFTPSSTGNQKTWTVSFWVKRGVITTSSAQMIFCSDTQHNEHIYARFCGTENTGKEDEFQIVLLEPNGRTSNVTTNRKFRDPSAFYHIVVRCDTTQSTSTNRLRVYVNGSQETSLRDNSQLNQNDDNMNWNDTVKHAIGHQVQSSTTERFLDGYISEFYNIDGTSLGPDSFGETNDNGVWIPKDAKNDLTFGTNGYYLQFKQTGTSANSSGIGADTSGNDHHWTPANLAATDQTTDTPTNNFAIVNPITETQGVIDFSEGNTQIAGNTTTQGSARSSIQIPPSGKWYIESEFDAIGGSGSNAFGIVTESYTSHSIDASGGRGVKASYSGGASSRVIQIMNGSSQIGSNINVSSGIIMQLAVDQDNGKAWLGKDDTYYNSSGGTDGNPANGSNPTFTFTAENFDVLFGAYKGGGGDAIQRQKVNFGNPAFTISSGNADANGYGNFEYAVPSGYYALCTKNLAEYG